VELHHRMKRDAPSGTAAAPCRGRRRRPGPASQGCLRLRAGMARWAARKSGTIGLSTLRGGDVVGDHTVHFLADGERPGIDPPRHQPRELRPAGSEGRPLARGPNARGSTTCGTCSGCEHDPDRAPLSRQMGRSSRASVQGERDRGDLRPRPPCSTGAGGSGLAPQALRGAAPATWVSPGRSWEWEELPGPRQGAVQRRSRRSRSFLIKPTAR